MSLNRCQQCGTRSAGAVREAVRADRRQRVRRIAPFDDSIVPTAFYGRDPRVSSVMIEVRRDLYMDEQSGERNANFSRLRDAVTDVLRVVASAAG